MCPPTLTLHCFCPKPAPVTACLKTIKATKNSCNVVIASGNLFDGSFQGQQALKTMRSINVEPFSQL